MEAARISFIRLVPKLLLLTLFCATVAHGKSLSFDEEYNLSLRAGKEELTEKERANLLKENHPILMQMGEPATRVLIESFANLPSALHGELRKKSYLIWDYRDLDIQHRKPFLDLVEANLAAARQQGVPPNPGFSVAALSRARVGYAVVDINPKKKTRVVSIFILWSETSPTWVTVVNAKLAGTQEYFQAHLRRLPMLGNMGNSPFP